MFCTNVNCGVVFMCPWVLKLNIQGFDPPNQLCPWPGLNFRYVETDWGGNREITHDPRSGEFAFTDILPPGCGCCSQCGLGSSHYCWAVATVTSFSWPGPNFLFLLWFTLSTPSADSNGKKTRNLRSVTSSIGWNQPKMMFAQTFQEL